MNNSNNFKSFWQNWCMLVSVWVWYAWIESAKSICTAHLDAIKCENVVVYIDHNFIYLVIFPQFYWHSAKQRDKCDISSTIQRLYYGVRYSLANDVWLKMDLNIYKSQSIFTSHSSPTTHNPFFHFRSLCNIYIYIVVWIRVKFSNGIQSRSTS